MNLTIEQIKKNNELFANSLTFKIIGKENFKKLLYSAWFQEKYINDYTLVIEKYINDYTNKLNKSLQNIKN